MQAYIYNDDKGDDITVTDIPEDMKDDAELYRTELVEKICELDDDLMMMYPVSYTQLKNLYCVFSGLCCNFLKSAVNDLLSNAPLAV